MVQHGFGVLKLLTILPEISQKILIAGLEKEMTLGKEGLKTQKTALSQIISSEAVMSIDLLIIFLELGLFGDLSKTNPQKQTSIKKCLDTILKQSGK